MFGRGYALGASPLLQDGWGVTVGGRGPGRGGTRAWLGLALPPYPQGPLVKSCGPLTTSGESEPGTGCARQRGG